MVEKILDVNDKYRKKSVTIKGIKYGSLSPYDFPLKVKAVYEEMKKMFSLSFTYLTPCEPIKVLKLRKGEILLQVGKISGKLYNVGINCPSKEDLPASVRIELVSELDKLIKDSEKKIPNRLVEHENLSVTRDFLSKEVKLNNFIKAL